MYKLLFRVNIAKKPSCFAKYIDKTVKNITKEGCLSGNFYHWILVNADRGIKDFKVVKDVKDIKDVKDFKDHARE
ncbi:MAG: hypothetical protein LBS54_09300 [Dysgonamonadaceae bacterium]|nr:hypothetical protein [Dysgonamonadaceae bacterium]